MPRSQKTRLHPEHTGRLKEALLKLRRERKPPETDHKMIAAWNGLALTALANASVVFERADLLEEAKKSASYLLSALAAPDGSLKRYTLDRVSVGKGLLEDYALMGLGLLSIYKASSEKRWFDEALKITGRMVALFHDGTTGLFFDAGADQEKLFVRERDLFDNDLPSGNSAAARLLMNISRLTGNESYASMAGSILRSIDGTIEDPVSHGNFFYALEEFLGKKK